MSNQVFQHFVCWKFYSECYDAWLDLSTKMFSSRIKQATLHKVKPIFIDNEESTTKVEIITVEIGQQLLNSENKWHTGFKLVGDTLTQVFFFFFFFFSPECICRCLFSSIRMRKWVYRRDISQETSQRQTNLLEIYFHSINIRMRILWDTWAQNN